MRKARIAYWGVVLATAASVVADGRMLMGILLLTEILLSVILWIMIGIETRSMSARLSVRPACQAGSRESVAFYLYGFHVGAAGRFQAVLEIDNRLLGERKEIPVSGAISGANTEMVLDTELEGCGKTWLRLKNIRCCDIFGLHSGKVADSEVLEIMVYPEEPQIRLIRAEDISGYREGEQQTISRRGNDPSEVYDLREYHPGDDVRAIHWKLSGKLGKMLIRESSDTSKCDTMILMDAGLVDQETAHSQAVLTSAIGFALAMSKKMADMEISHYAAIPAGDRLFVSSISERPEHEKMEDTWLNLRLPERSGLGIRYLAADEWRNRCRQLIYITVGAELEPTDLFLNDMDIIEIHILEQGDSVRMTENGRRMLLEIPQGCFHDRVYNITV